MVELNNQNPPKEFFIACIIAVLVSNVCCSFGYMVSCMSSSPTMAITIAPPFIVPFMLFGGFFLNVKSIPKWLRWIKYLSWFYYGNEAFAINQWESIPELYCPDAYKTSDIPCPPGNGEDVLKQFNFEKDNITQDMLSLLALVFLYKILAYLALLTKTYRRKKWTTSCGTHHAVYTENSKMYKCTPWYGRIKNGLYWAQLLLWFIF